MGLWGLKGCGVSVIGDTGLRVIGANLVVSICVQLF